MFKQILKYLLAAVIVCYTLFALVDGKVKFETKRNNKKQVSVYAI